MIGYKSLVLDLKFSVRYDNFNETCEKFHTISKVVFGLLQCNAVIITLIKNDLVKFRVMLIWLHLISRNIDICNPINI